MVHQETYTVASNPVSIEYGNLNVLFAGDSQTKPGHQLGPKVFDFYLLHHVLSGWGEFHSGGTTYRLGKGQSFLIEPGQLVTYASDPQQPWHYKWVAYAGKQAADLTSSVGLSADLPIINTIGNRKPGALIQAIQQSFRRSGSYANLEASGYLQLLFAQFGSALETPAQQLLRAGDESSLLVQQVVHYLSTQYAEPVSMERMADTLGFNRAYLSRVFKRHTGLSPVTFLLKLRIDKARRLLRERQELTVEQIAASAGFQDPLYFSKQFRRFYGQPPTAYREDVRRM